MNHLEFSYKLNELGIQIHSTKIENKSQIIEVHNTFSPSDFVEIKNFQCKYLSETSNYYPPVKAAIKTAIDIDTWKHSIHHEISSENYEKFREIIQDKILKRASEIEMLITVYFQLNHEISNKTE